MSINSRKNHFLLLPAEIRLNVLRLLLVREPNIRQGAHIDACIFRVNRQLYNESLPLFYGENIFHIMIRSQHGKPEIDFCQCDYAVRESKIQIKIPLYRMIRKYDIYVETHDDSGGNERLKWAVRKLAGKLSVVPRLELLRITIGPHRPSYRPPELLAEMNRQNSRVLKAFRLLRNVRTVDIRGDVSKKYARLLKSEMESQTPLDYLPTMYRLLADLVETTDDYGGYLHGAVRATNNRDGDMFKTIRTQMVAQFVERTQARLNRLTDHDSDAGQYRWIIQQVHRDECQ